MGKKKEEPAEESAPFWVVAYLDLTQQFLAFFILMFSLSTIDVAKLMAILESFRKATGGGKPIPGLHKPLPLVARIRSEIQGTDTSGTVMRPVSEGDQVLVERAHEGLKITLEGMTLFRQGSAELTESGKRQIITLMNIVTGYLNFLEIRGFTSENPEDAILVNGKPDHVELSYRRARAVYEYMVSAPKYPVEAERLRVTGCGTSSPIVASSKGNPRDKNRRVEVIVSEEMWIPPTAR